MGNSIHSLENCVHIKYFNYGHEDMLYVEADSWSEGLQRFRQIYGEDIPGKFYIMTVSW